MEQRIGLEEVFCPPEDKLVAQIVFVHGLFGHRRKTWTSQMSTSNTEREGAEDNGSEGVFWPRLLPAVLPGAQILTWGYDADVSRFLGSSGQNTVHQHATNLLSDLADSRQDGPKVPIIFVCHSLGGIVVKDALTQSIATEGTRLKEIAPAAYGVIFLGTPHRGSKSASLGRYAYNITLAATKRPNLKLLRALERNSEVLDRVTDAFNQMLLKQEIRLYSFREEQETRKYLVFNTMVACTSLFRSGRDAS
ncbi:MAG: hypothetical protein M1818_000729 [Claussenomyces sp. TS43310]|nr:MAG: hypothetical protein M1818_000729 [Claussenomyces sp. TS43310]